jgi:hypothetical protein
MVKDNKFAAEPTADASADSKKTRGDSKVATTESVTQANPDATPEVKKLSDSSSDKDIYNAYVNGAVIDSIALEVHKDSQEVVQIIEKIEKSRSKSSSK